MNAVEFDQLCDELKEKEIKASALKLAKDYAASIDYDMDRVDIPAYYNFAQRTDSEPYDMYLGAYVLHQITDGKGQSDTLKEFEEAFNFKYEATKYRTAEELREIEDRLEKMAAETDDKEFFYKLMYETMYSYGVNVVYMRYHDTNFDGTQMYGIPLEGERFKKAYEILGNAKPRRVEDDREIYGMPLEYLMRNRVLLGQTESTTSSRRKGKFEKVYMSGLRKVLDTKVEVEDKECQEASREYEQAVIDRVENSKQHFTKSVVDLAFQYGKRIGYDPNEMGINSLIDFLRHTSFTVSDAIMLWQILRSVGMDTYGQRAIRWDTLNIYKTRLLECIDYEQEAKTYFTDKEFASLRATAPTLDSKRLINLYINMEFLWAGISPADLNKVMVDDIKVVDGHILRYKDIEIDSEFAASFFLTNVKPGELFTKVFYTRAHVKGTGVLERSKSEVYYSGVMYRSACLKERYPESMSDFLQGYYQRIEKVLYS